jgi:hypothetical protein
VMHTLGMKVFSSLATVLPFLPASAFPARAQAVPEVHADAQARASLDAQGKAILDELAMKILQGRPAVAIMGISLVNGAPSKLTNASVRDSVELTLRRNGIPIVPSCEIGSNCGRLVSAIRAKCVKDLFPRIRPVARRAFAQFISELNTKRPSLQNGPMLWLRVALVRSGLTTASH